MNWIRYLQIYGLLARKSEKANGLRNPAAIFKEEF
jgi:hypothetical protein